MDYQDRQHSQLIEQDRQESQRNHDWCRTLGWSFLSVALCLLPLYVWYQTSVPTNNSTALLQLIGVILLTALLLLVAILSFQVARLWQRELKFSILRFDIYQANNEVWHSLFQRYIPDYRNNNTELTVAEELMRTVTWQTKRSADIARQYEVHQASKDYSLAQAVDMLVAQSLENRNIRATRKNINAVYDSLEFDGDTLIPFPQKD